MALLGLLTKIQMCEKNIPKYIYGLNLSDKGLFYSQNLLLLSDTFKARDVATDKAVDTNVKWPSNKDCQQRSIFAGKSSTFQMSIYRLNRSDKGLLYSGNVHHCQMQSQPGILPVKTVIHRQWLSIQCPEILFKSTNR